MYSREIIKINTKITDVEQIKEMAQHIVDFADKHDIQFNLFYNDEHELVYNCVMEGKTIAYCKGMLAEVKQMVKETFHCKLETLFKQA